MRVFIDTNIFAEFIFERAQSASVQRLFHAIKEKRIDAYTSSSSIYTMAYISEQMLKRKGIHLPELTDQVRKIIESLLQLVHIGSIEHSDMMIGVNDTSFSDIEDSFQHQCALKNGCNYLITINTKDFSKVNQDLMKVISPNDFVNNYLN
jgi:predicted nucleic acid-binding protein